MVRAGASLAPRGQPFTELVNLGNPKLRDALSPWIERAAGVTSMSALENV
jgi:hypothetical protein